MTDVNPLNLAVIAAVERAHHARMVQHALREATPTQQIRGGPITSPGDRTRMRGVPITAVGVGGTQPGTQPLHALLAAERRATLRDVTG